MVEKIFAFNKLKINKNKDTLILWLILGLGLGLRIYNLAGKPLWYDEVDSIAAAQKPLEYFFGSPGTFNYKILYFLILKGWIRIFGPWEYPTRFLSVIFGILSIYMIYRLVYILYNRNIAVWSALLLSISTFHVYHSQQVRHYTLFVTLTIVSFYLFTKLYLNQKPMHILLSVVINFLLLNTYPYSILIILVQFLLIFIFLKKFTKVIFLSWIIMQFTGVALYSVLFLIPSLNYIQEKIWWIPKPNISILIETFLTFMFGGPRYGLDDYKIPQHFLIISAIFSICFFYLFLFGLGKAFSKKINRSITKKEFFGNVILVCWFFYPLVTTYLFCYLKPVFVIKHLIYLLPPFLILTANGIEYVRRITLKVCLVIPIILCSFFSLCTLYANDYNINWRQPAEYISKNLKSDETVAICISKEIVPFIYYFDYRNKDKFRKIDIYGMWTYNGWEEVFRYDDTIIVGIRQEKLDGSMNIFKDFMHKYAENKLLWRDKNLWLAISRWGVADNIPKIERELNRSHSKIIEKKFNGVTVYYWKKL